MGNAVPSMCLSSSARLQRDISAQQLDVETSRKKAGLSSTKFHELKQTAGDLFRANRKAEALALTNALQQAAETMAHDARVLSKHERSLQALTRTRDMDRTAKATKRATDRVRRSAKHLKLNTDEIEKILDDEEDSTEQIDGVAKLLYAPQTASMEHVPPEVELQDDTQRRFERLMGMSTVAPQLEHKAAPAATTRPVALTPSAPPPRQLVAMEDDEQSTVLVPRETTQQPRVTFRTVTVAA